MCISAEISSMSGMWPGVRSRRSRTAAATPVRLLRASTSLRHISSHRRAVCGSAWGSGSFMSVAGKMLRCCWQPKVGRMPIQSV